MEKTNYKGEVMNSITAKTILIALAGTGIIAGNTIAGTYANITY